MKNVFLFLLCLLLSFSASAQTNVPVVPPSPYFSGLGVGTAALNKADIAGNAAIGTNYAGLLSAPTNGLIVQGNVGIGTSNPTTALQIGSTGSGCNISSTGIITGCTWNGGSINLSSYASGTLQAAQFPALTGNVTTTAGSLATTIGAGVVTNAMLAGSITASNLVGTDIATVGTITSGTWHGTPIGSSYISQVYPASGIASSSGAAWNSSYATTGSGTTLALSTSPQFSTAIGIGTAPFSSATVGTTSLAMFGGTWGSGSGPLVIGQTSTDWYIWMNIGTAAPSTTNATFWSGAGDSSSYWGYPTTSGKLGLAFSGNRNSWFANNQLAVGTSAASFTGTLYVAGSAIFGPNLAAASPPTGGLLIQGNVAIGTAAAPSKLTVNGLAGTSPGSGGGYVCADSNGDFYVKSTCP